MLSQHEQVVSELREEDVERGLTLKSPVKSIDENFPILNEGTWIHEYEENIFILYLIDWILQMKYNHV